MEDGSNPRSQPEGTSGFLFLTQTPKTFNSRKSVADRKIRHDKAKNAHVQQGFWQARKAESTKKLRWKRAVLVRDERGLRLSSKSKSKSKSKSRSPTQTPSQSARVSERSNWDPRQLQSISSTRRIRSGITKSQSGSFEVNPVPTTSEARVATVTKPHDLPTARINRASSPVQQSIEAKTHDLPIGRLYKITPPVEQSIVRFERANPRPIGWIPSSPWYGGPKSLLDTSFIDPFATASLPISKDMNLDIMHCTTFVFPVIYQFDVQAESSIRMWLELAFSHPSLLYSVLAAALLHRRAVMSNPIFAHMTAQIDRQFLYYKIMAIKTINEALEDKEEAYRPWTLWAIVSMLAIETMIGTEREMLPHRFGILRILELRGGLDGLPEVLVDGLLPTLHWASYWTSTKPQYPPPPNGVPLSAETAQRVQSGLHTSQYELCCTAFKTPSVDALLSRKLRVAIQDIQDNIQFREAHTGGGWGATLEEIQYINYQAHRSRYTFLAISPEEFDSPEQESLCIALGTFTAATDEFFDPQSPVLRSLIPRLKAALQRSDLRSLWKPSHEALIWILGIGALQSAGQAERPWFILQLLRGVQLLDLTTFEDLELLLRKFCYIDRLYAESLAQVWQEVEMMREALPSEWHP